MFDTLLVYLGMDLLLSLLVVAVAYFNRKRLMGYAQMKLMSFLGINALGSRMDNLDNRTNADIDYLEEKIDSRFNRVLNRSKYDRKLLKKIKAEVTE